MSQIDRELFDRLYHPPRPRGFNHLDPLWSEVLPGLWQGGTDDEDLIGKRDEFAPAEITAADFDTVVTMYRFANPVDWQVREFRFGIYDCPIENMPQAELFDLVRLAHSDWKRGKRVLVRCQAGLNRSGLVSALILIREGYTAVEAIELLRAARSNWVLFNLSFVDFLLHLDVDEWRGAEFPSQVPSAA